MEKKKSTFTFIEMSYFIYCILLEYSVQIAFIMFDFYNCYFNSAAFFYYLWRNFM